MIQRTTAADWLTRHENAFRQATNLAMAFQAALLRTLHRTCRVGSNRTARLRKKRRKAIERMWAD